MPASLVTLPEALKVLNANRTNLVDAFTALRTFSNVASRRGVRYPMGISLGPWNGRR